MTNKIYYKENKLWQLKMSDGGILHRVEVYVGNDHIGDLSITDKYLATFVGKPGT